MTATAATMTDDDDRGDDGTAECSVIEQSLGCFGWLLNKLAPFCLGFTPYPIVTVPTDVNVASVIIASDCRSSNGRGADGNV